MKTVVKVLSGQKEKKTQEKVATIEYDYSIEPPYFYATGARIIAMGPNFNKLAFYIDDPQDIIEQETVFFEGDKQTIRPTKFRFDSKRHVKRRFVATIHMPMTLMKSLAEVLPDIIKQHEAEKPHGEKEK